MRKEDATTDGTLAEQNERTTYYQRIRFRRRSLEFVDSKSENEFVDSKSSWIEGVVHDSGVCVITLLVLDSSLFLTLNDTDVTGL